MARVWSRVVVGAALGAVTLFGLGGVALAAEGRVKQSPGPEPGSPEEKLYTDFLVPKDWAKSKGE